MFLVFLEVASCNIFCWKFQILKLMWNIGLYSIHIGVCAKNEFCYSYGMNKTDVWGERNLSQEDLTLRKLGESSFYSLYFNAIDIKKMWERKCVCRAATPYIRTYCATRQFFVKRVCVLHGYKRFSTGHRPRVRLIFAVKGLLLNASAQSVAPAVAALSKCLPTYALCGGYRSKFLTHTREIRRPVLCMCREYVYGFNNQQVKRTKARGLLRLTLLSLRFHIKE